MNFIDITGQQFGKLTVLEKDTVKSTPGVIYWWCLCECGNKVSIRGNHLKRGFTKSCGCLQKQTAKEMHTTHGMKNTAIYRAWNSMKSRCNLPHHRSHEYYYDRGITYCNEWEQFENFYEDMKDTYFVHAFLDRKDNDKGYSKDNCRWVTVAESNKNRRCVKKEC